MIVAETISGKNSKSFDNQSYPNQSKSMVDSWTYQKSEHRKLIRDKQRASEYIMQTSKLLALKMAIQSSPFTFWTDEETVHIEPIHENAVTKIESALASSKEFLLGLRDDWDGEGSPGYSKETWDRMADFLLSYCDHMAEFYGAETPVPQIDPGPNGSIDLLWRSKNYELLLNIPPELNVPATFYGDDKGQISIKGKIDTAKINQGLLQWLMNHPNP